VSACDPAGDLERFLELLWEPGDVREVRAPKHDGRNTLSGYYDDPARLAADVAPWDGRANLYLTLNPVDPALMARAQGDRIDPRAQATTSDADVVARRWLAVDVDPDRPSGVSATDDERAAALATARAIADHLHAQGWGWGVVVDSGNGYWLLYRTELPNDDDSRRLVEGFLRYLAAMFGSPAAKVDGTVGNAARIGPLVGTMKVKGRDLPDRPHRRTSLVHVPEALTPVPADAIARLVPPEPAREPAGAGQDHGWVRRWLDHNGVDYRETVRNGVPWYNLRDCPWHPDEDPYSCGPGELASGTAVYHGMHDRCRDKRWADYRAEARIEPPPGIVLVDSPKVSAAPDVGSGRRKLTHRTARELAAETPEDVEWEWLPYVAAGAITELDGRPKAAGKSTLLAHLIAAVLDGSPFLGTPTRRTPVVLLTEQSAGTARVLLGRAGLTERDDLHVVLWHDARDVPWPEVVEQAAGLCREAGAGLLVIDTLPQFAGLAGDMENDSGAALAAMRPVQAAAASGLAVIVSRHDRKGGGEVGESGRGSSAFAGAVDVIIQLRRADGEARKGIRHLSALSRFDETPELLVIELTEAGYVALGTAEAVALQEARDAIAEALGAEGMTMAELLAATGLRRTTAQAVLAEMDAAGTLAKTGAGRKGDPFRYARRDADGGAEMLSAGLPPYGGKAPPTDTPVADGALWGPPSQPTASTSVPPDAGDLRDVAEVLFLGDWLDDHGATAEAEEASA